MSEANEAIPQWLQAARSGEQAALGDALEACRTYLLHVAEHELDPLLRAKGGASDLVQQTFVKAHEHFSTFQGDTGAEWTAWLRRILVNNLANFRRDWLQTEKRQAHQEVRIDDRDSTSPGTSWLAGSEPTPSRHVMADEAQAALNRAMKQLPEDYVQILRLRYLEDLPFEDIAERMGRTANAVRKLWARAVERLQEQLNPSHDSTASQP